MAPRKGKKRNEIVASSPLVELTLLHRAMRLELEAMVKAAEQLEGEQRKAISSEAVRSEVWELERRFHDFDLVFASHSSVEDDFVFPTLATRGATPSFTQTAAVEHEEETQLMRSVEDAFRRIRAGEDTALELLRSRLRILKERLSEHMLQEEEAIFPHLASFSSSELSRLVGLVMGSRPSEVLEASIRMEVTHLDPDLARHVLSTMCDVAHKTAFRDWLDFKFRQHTFDRNRPRPPRADYVPANRGDACPHYGHSTRLVAPCCGALVCCRRCHDQAAVCPIAMDQRAVTSMRCAACGLDQPIAEICSNCAIPVAAYFCDICKLLVDTNEPVYHCPYCNICRRGFGLGVDHMHCMDCNLCVTMENMSTHPCGPNARALAGIDPDECV